MSKKSDLSRNSTEKRAWSIAAPFLEKQGFKLWDVIFEKEGAMWYLRVLFYKSDENDSLNISDCENMTPPLNALFDKEDFIKNVDILEIGSPGLTARLRKPFHFERSVGKRVRIATRGENGKTIINRGILSEFNGETINIGEKVFEINKCLRINLDLIFLEGDSE